MRHKVVGWIPDGGRVKILLVQTNPVLDFYQVRSLDLANPQTGWVPAPFLSMSPPSS
ncbi:MAG TPA: SH3 domain-containing protein [Nitrolancea sp.]|nr:SH3 domain-containing protein [Nitrolancea sp.]